MALVTPFWFKQRQAKAEEAGPDMAHMSGPNLKEAFVGIRRGDNGLWMAFVRLSADGPDIEGTPPTMETAYVAWEAAFEMYRQQLVV